MSDDEVMFEGRDVTTSFLVGINSDDLEELVQEGHIEIPGSPDYDKIIIEVCDDE